MTKGRLFVKNALIIGAGKLITSLISFAALPFYVKALSAHDYGLVDIIVVYVTLFCPLVSLRLELSVFRWVVGARDKSKEAGRAISSAVKIVAVSTFVATIIFGVVAYFLQLEYALYVYCFFLSLISYNLVVQVPRGFGDNITYTLANIIYGLSSTLIGLVLLFVCNMGVEALLIGYISAGCIAVVYVALKVNLMSYFRGVKGFDVGGEMLRYSVPMIPDQLSNLGIFTGSKVLVSAMLGVAANGLYAVAGRFASILLSALDVFEVAWTESATVHINDADRERFFTKITNSAIALFYGAAALLLVAIAIIYPLVIDRSFHDAYYLIPVLIIGYLGNGIAKIFGAIFLGLKKTQILMKTTIAAGAISLIGTALTIHFIGLWAPVLFVAAAYYCLAFSRLYYLKKEGVYIHIHFMTLLRVMIALAISCVFYFIELDMVTRVLSGILLFLWVLYINKDVAELIRSMAGGRIKSIVRAIAPAKQKRGFLV